MGEKESVDLKTKVCCVIDNGLFYEFARVLKRSFGEVLYFTEWRSAFPSKKAVMIGEGFSDIERINSIFDNLDRIDVFVFPDVYDGDLAEFLVSIGKRVFSGKGGEDMELDRDSMKEHMRELGLPVNHYEIVIGLDALRDYLKKNNNVYVKVNSYRSDFETFHSENYELTEPILDDLEQKLGAMKTDYEFIVEDAIDGEDVCETGSDLFSIDGQFPDRVLYGYELKDLAYCAVVKDYKSISPIITDFNKAIAPTLKQYQYRGFMSTEIRVGKDKKPYMIDFCARAGSPPNELYQEIISNWGEIIWYGAEGIMVQPKYLAKYGVEFLIHSDWADNHWQAVRFPDKIAQWVKLRNACKINGVYNIVPQDSGLPEIGAVVAIGDTLEECIKKAKGYAEQVKGYRIDIKTDTVDDIYDVISKGEKLGIKFN